MTIRAATEGDLDEILAMVQELADYEREPEAMVADRDEFAHHLFGPDAVARGLIAEYEGAVAGMALYYRTFSTWLGRDGIWLEDLFVRPDHRRHGYGRALGAAPVDGWSIWRWPPIASSE